MDQNNYNPYGQYGNYSPYNNYNEAPQKQAPKRSGGRTLALVLAGAVLGSVIGGGAVLLSQPAEDTEGLTTAQQSYIDSAVSSQLAMLSSSSDVQKLSSTDYSSGVQSVAQEVMPSVVGVRTVATQQMFYRQQQTEGYGTGIIVSEDGLILTNQHVVAGSNASVTVTLMDGSEYDAQVLFADESMDLAVIKIDAQGLSAATLGDSDRISIGEVAIAIGNPLGLNYQRSVTAGIISATGRSILLSQTQIAENLIQTDAAINQGNSGGPLLNGAGEVIGINSYKLSSGEGMGFAIPISAAKPIIDQIMQTGSFSEATIGASFIDSNMLNYYDFGGLELGGGLYVYSVDPSSDSAAQGLTKGDVITKVDGVTVDTLLELKQQLYIHTPGDTVTLTVERDGEELAMSVKLG